MKKFISIVSLAATSAFFVSSCATLINGSKQSIRFSSEPAGAKVFANGIEICGSTPCETKVKRSGNPAQFTFMKDGYQVSEANYPAKVSGWYWLDCLPAGIPAIVDLISGGAYYYDENVHRMLIKSPYALDPTIREGEATNRVTRDKPGSTALERTIIRWNFDSDPRGCRIFWRVISSIPDEVKNTNELYLTTTPYEETRSFNILGLTYENSRDVTVEIKLTKKGFEDQVKRYNVRQAIDQQEIGGFFEMVEKDRR